jgi:hypothetical protein
VRDRVTLLASGGIVMAEHVPKAIACGAEAVALDTILWVALQNALLFGISVDRLLTVDGARQPPERVYRKVRPVAHQALSPEEAWVKRET